MIVETGKEARAPFTLVPIPPPSVPTPAPAAPVPPPPVSHTGKVRVEVTPDSATVAYRSASDALLHEATSPLLELEEGNYVISAHAPGYVDSFTSITVEAGITKPVTLQLAPIKRPKPALVVRTINESDWGKPWSQDDGWYTRQGAGFITFFATPPLGVIQFTARLKKPPFAFTSPKLRLVLNYVDEKNYMLIEIDKQTYGCAEYHNGKRSVHVDKKKHGLAGDNYGVELTVASDRILVKLSSDNKGAAVVDEWTRPGLTDNSGRFGFYLPGGSQVWFKDFSFRAGQ